jgi:hypothetical protein
MLLLSAVPVPVSILVESPRTDRLQLQPVCVNPRPALGGWWDNQLTIIDAHYTAHTEFLANQIRTEHNQEA